MCRFDPYDGAPHLLQTDPAGVYLEWKANAIGRNSKSVREYLERAYNEEAVASDRGLSCNFASSLYTISRTIPVLSTGTLKLALRALLEVVQSGAKNVEVALLARQQPLRFLSERVRFACVRAARFSPFHFSCIYICICICLAARTALFCLFHSRPPAYLLILVVKKTNKQIRSHLRQSNTNRWHLIVCFVLSSPFPLLDFIRSQEIDELLVEINRDKEQEAAEARARSQRK